MNPPSSELLRRERDPADAAAPVPDDRVIQTPPALTEQPNVFVEANSAELLAMQQGTNVMRPSVEILEVSAGVAARVGAAVGDLRGQAGIRTQGNNRTGQIEAMRAAARNN